MASPNALFALFSVSTPAAMETKLREFSQFPLIYTKTSPNSWFVITPVSVLTRELSDLLGITDGTVSSGILVRVENYFGRTSKDVWEWLSANMNASLPIPVRPEAAVEHQANA